MTRRNGLTHFAANCLECACVNPANPDALALLFETNSLTPLGIAAAVYIADSEEHDRIVELSRRAIATQRQWCAVNGPFRPAECLRFDAAFPLTLAEDTARS